MRKAMICVGFMLAVLQLWPMAFEQRNVIDVTSPGAQAAVIILVPKRVAVVMRLPTAQPAVASVSETSKP